MTPRNLNQIIDGEYVITIFRVKRSYNETRPIIYVPEPKIPDYNSQYSNVCRLPIKRLIVDNEDLSSPDADIVAIDIKDDIPYKVPNVRYVLWHDEIWILLKQNGNTVLLIHSNIDQE